MQAQREEKANDMRYFSVCRRLFAPVVKVKQTDAASGTFFVRQRQFPTNPVSLPAVAAERPGGAVFAFQVGKEGVGERPFNTSEWIKKAKGAKNGRFQPSWSRSEALMTRRLWNGIG
ncbi:MAG: hypothetical protein R6X34_22565 [Chloroflexota bacterium]